MRLNNKKWRVRFLFISVELYLMAIHLWKPMHLELLGVLNHRVEKQLNQLLYCVKKSKYL